MSKTIEYIELNQKEFVLEILNLHQNEPNFDTKPYEEILSANLNNYINDDRLLSLQIPTLNRIITKYFANENNNEKQKDEIIEFLFKILDQKGRKASVLFNSISFGTRSQECVSRLISQYSKIFDFQFITSQIIEILISTQKEVIQLKGKLDQKNQLNDQLKTQIETIKKDNRSLREELNQRKIEYSKETEIQKQNSTKQEKEISRLKQELKTRLTQQELQNKFQNLIPINKEWKKGRDLDHFILNDKMVYEVISSSTFHDSKHLSKNLFDGKNEINDDRNVWACSANDNNPFIQIKFSRPTVADCLMITARRQPWGNQAPSYFEIFGIKDNNQSVLLGKFKTQNWNPNEKKFFYFLNDKLFSIYQFNFLRPGPAEISLAGLNLSLIDI